MTTRPHHLENAAESEGLDLPDKADGPAAAALISAGIGIFALGLFTLLSELSEATHDFLADMELGRGVGPLAGKTILAVLAFFVAWGVLGFLWRDRDVDIKRSFWIGSALGIIGAILTFPPVFAAFG